MRMLIALPHPPGRPIASAGSSCPGPEPIMPQAARSKTGRHRDVDRRSGPRVPSHGGVEAAPVDAVAGGGVGCSRRRLASVRPGGDLPVRRLGVRRQRDLPPRRDPVLPPGLQRRHRRDDIALRHPSAPLLPRRGPHRGNGAGRPVRRRRTLVLSALHVAAVIPAAWLMYTRTNPGNVANGTPAGQWPSRLGSLLVDAWRIFFTDLPGQIGVAGLVSGLLVAAAAA